MSTFALASWSAVLGVIVLAATLRSRAYAIFRGVLLSVYTLIATALFPYLTQVLQQIPIWGAVIGAAPLYYLHAMMYLDPALLVRPRLRPLWYRALISLPAQYVGASMLLAFPWAIVAAFGVTPHGAFLPFLVGALGLYQSLTIRKEQHDLFVGEAVSEIPVPARVQHPAPHKPTTSSHPPLRIVQITDPHIGPFMSVRRLARICQQAVDAAPDLIVLTGDFLTMESQADSAWLGSALAPLKVYRGKTFACLGNHDHEAPVVVREALTSAGVRLLVDEQTTVETAAGKVQILGFDFHFRERAERTAEILENNPREDGCLRLVLLHDPGAFKHFPSGTADLVLSGHTHGGQVGLHSFGQMWTFVSAIAKMPDHSLWGHGTNRLWVHRGTGHYGFPLRLGVSAEESVLSIYRAARD